MPPSFRHRGEDVSRRLMTLGIGLSLVTLTSWTGLARAVTSGTPAGSSGSSIRVRGHVVGLYPGARKAMRVRIGNRSTRAVLVTGIKVRSGDASPACLGTNLRFRPLRAPIVVGAGASKTTQLRVRMRRSAPDACQGARFPLRFAVTAVQR